MDLVWVVEGYEASEELRDGSMRAGDYSVFGVFSTEEKARAYIDKHKLRDVYAEPYEVDGNS